MINKVRLGNFIKKYYLSGRNNSVVWTLRDDVLSTSFTTPDSSIFGFVTLENIKLPDTKFGVSNTKQLIKMLSMMDRQFSVRIVDVNNRPSIFQMEDQKIQAKYTLSDLDVIPLAPQKDQLPDWDFKVTVPQETLDVIVKSVSALEKKDLNFTILNDLSTGKTRLVVGYSSITATDRISTVVESSYDGNTPPFRMMTFSADDVKEIILANNESDEMIMEVSSQYGIAKIAYNLIDFNSEYYLVKQDDE